MIISIASGKDGAGKTSIVVSFAALAKNKVLVDADVDAADLHLAVSYNIQKYDINYDISLQIDSFANKNNLKMAGSVPYDKDVAAAMLAQKSLVEFSNGKEADDMRRIWEEVEAFMLDL